VAFNERSPLYQQVEDTEDVKAPRPPRGTEDTGAPAMLRAFSDAGLDIREPQSEEMGRNPNSVMDSVEDAGNLDIRIREKGSTVPDVKQGPAPARFIADLTGQLPEPLQQDSGRIAQREISAEKAQFTARLAAGQFLAQTQADAAFIADTDQAVMKAVNETYLAKWETENEIFKQEIDHARQMKVNPNNYMQSIGRSGRVASAFAVGVSQLAAGAGAVSSVMKRINTAVEQDISAQEFNIKQAWAGIAAGQNQQDREMDLINQYFSFRDRARAIAYTALAAQAGAIKQHAENESTFIAYQMVEDRARAQAHKAIADAMAKMGTVHVDWPLRKIADLLRARGFTREAQDALNLGQPRGGQAPQGPTGVRMLNGSYVDSGQGQQPVMGAPAATAALPSAAPQGTAPNSPAPRTRGSKRGGSKLPGGGSVQDAPLGTGPLANEPTAQTETPAQTEPKAQPKQAQGGLEEVAASAEAYMDQLMSKDPTAMAHGSAARYRDRKRPDVGSYMTNREAAREIIENPQHYALAESGPDASNLMKVDKKFNPYKDSPDVEVIRNKAKTGARLNDNETEMLIEANMNMRALAIRQSDFNYYMRPVHDSETGAGNIQFIGDGRIVRLRQGSTAYKDTTDGEKARENVIHNMNQAYDFVEGVSASAERMMESGFGNFFGLIGLTDEPGFSGVEIAPEFSEKMAVALGWNKAMIPAMGAEVMKLIDESGRLTDMDILVGERIFSSGNLLSGGRYTWDAINKIVAGVAGYENVDPNIVRKAVRRIMQGMALHIIDKLMSRGAASVNVLYTPEAAAQLRAQRDASERWLLSKEGSGTQFIEGEGAYGFGKYGAGRDNSGKRLKMKLGGSPPPTERNAINKLFGKMLGEHQPVPDSIPNEALGVPENLARPEDE